MAIAAWKRFEKTPGWQRKKRFLKRLTGKELRLRTEIKVPIVKDGGWWFTPEGLNSDSIVYSLGVGDEIDFDLSIIDKYGVEVHAFDPTPSSIGMLGSKSLPEKFHFHPWAVTAADGTLNFYPRLKKDGTKSDVMYTMIAEEETRQDVIEVPAYSLSSIAQKTRAPADRLAENRYRRRGIRGARGIACIDNQAGPAAGRIPSPVSGNRPGKDRYHY